MSQEAAGNPDAIRHLCNVPEGALVVGVHEVVSYLTADGEREFAVRRAGSDPYAATVGMLVWAQHRLVREWIGEET